MQAAAFLIVILLLGPSVVRADEMDDRLVECWNAPYEGSLEEYRSRQLVVALPSGLKLRGELDTTAYSWEGTAGVFRVEPGALASDVDAQRLARLRITGGATDVYRWRDYGGVDRLFGQWRLGSNSIRNIAVSIPVESSDCASFARARKILESVRFINDFDKIVVKQVATVGDKRIAVVLNEIGETHELTINDDITSDGGVISAIDRDGVVVRRYDHGRGRWIKRRLPVGPRVE